MPRTSQLLWGTPDDVLQGGSCRAQPENRVHTLTHLEGQHEFSSYRGYSGKEQVMGMSTAAGRLRESQRHQIGAVTWMGCHCCWERSQVGTIKCHVKRFSKLIFISFLLIISPQIAGYNTPAYCPFSSGIPGSATRCTDPLVCLSAHTSNCEAH